MRISLIAIITLLLLVFPIAAIGAEGQSEPPVFSESIEFEFNNLIGSDGIDHPKQVAIDDNGDFIIAFQVDYPVFDTGVSGPRSFYSGPYYDRDPNFKTFNITSGAYSTSYNGWSDIVLTKFNSAGEIIFSTYFGGSKADTITGLTVNNNGDIVLVGYTQSDDFPLKNPVDDQFGEISKGFISIFTTDGDLKRSTLWGGTNIDRINELKIDENNNIYISGSTKSGDYPILNPTFESVEVDDFTAAAFITKLTPELDVVYSTLVGGSDIDDDYALELSDNGDLIMMGLTKSDDFPTSENAINRTHNGHIDAFYTRLDSDGDVKVSTFVGGFLLDWISSTALDSEGNVVLTGYSNSRDYPTENSEDSELNNGDGLASDAVITKIDPSGRIIWSTFFGGKTSDRGVNILMDSQDNPIIVGLTNSQNFPVYGIEEDLMINQGKTFDEGVPPTDVFVAKFVSDGRLAWSTVTGSEGQEGFGDAILVDDSSLIITGHTIDKISFPATNTYRGTKLDDAFYGIVEVPEVDLPENGTYPNYKEVMNEGSTEGDNDTLFPWLRDPFSVAVLIATGSVILYNIVSKMGVFDNLRSKKNDEWKQEIREYHEKLNSIDENQD